MFEKPPEHNRRAQIFLSGAITCATLWDFRFHDIRVFDMAGLVMLVVFFILQQESLTGWLQRRQNILFLYGVFIAYAVFGLILHSHRSSLAIIILSLIGLTLNGRHDWLKATAVLRCLIIGHMIFFFLQFGAYYIFGYALDLYQFFGAPSRIYRSATEIRAAGLFQEPNSYCLNLFLLTTLATLQRSSRILIFFVATTMVLSQSLWGFGAAGILILMNEAREATPFRRFVTICAATLLIITAIFNVYLWSTKPKSDQLPWFYVRIMQLISDPSFHDRYIGRDAGEVCGVTEHSKASIETGDPNRSSFRTWIFGEGLTTAFFLQCLPANGGAFLFKSFGLLGLVAVGSGLALALRKATIRDRIFVIVAIVFSMTTYPLMTYLIFWIWLAGLIGVANEKGALLLNTSDVPARQST